MGKLKGYIGTIPQILTIMTVFPGIRLALCSDSRRILIHTNLPNQSMKWELDIMGYYIYDIHKSDKYQ